MLTNLVVGYPLTHTLSPRLHQLVYQAIDINAELKAFATPSLAEVLAERTRVEAGLMAVTMPFKEAILPFLDELSPEAASLEAVNTVIAKNHSLIGYNTDIDGIRYAFRDVVLEQKKALIFGAGGAAKAAGYFFKSKQMTLYWVNRTAARAQQLASMFGGVVISVNEIKDLDVDIIVNSTPLGMQAYDDSSPYKQINIQPHQVVFDMVYRPVVTPLLREAKHAGATVISGMDMFISQGVRQIEIWQQKSIINPDLINILGGLYHE